MLIETSMYVLPENHLLTCQCLKEYRRVLFLDHHCLLRIQMIYLNFCCPKSRRGVVSSVSAYVRNWPLQSISQDFWVCRLISRKSLEKRTQLMMTVVLNIMRTLTEFTIEYCRMAYTSNQTKSRGQIIAQQCVST